MTQSELKSAFKTISLRSLQTEWQPLLAVDLASCIPFSAYKSKQSPSPHRKRRSPRIDDTDSSDAHSTDHSDEDSVRELKVKTHGGLQKILSRKERRNGKVTYTVLWSNGKKTEESPLVLRGFANQLEEFEHERLRENLGRSRTSTPDSIPSVQPESRSTRKRVRWAAAEYDESFPSDHDDESPKQETETITHTREAYKRRIQKPTHFMNTLPRVDSPKPRTLFKANVKEYNDATFIDLHWNWCLKCKQTGYVNGPPKGITNRRRRQRSTPLPETSSDEEPDPDEQGRLLLCNICAVATHEGCLPNTKTLRDKCFYPNPVGDGTSDLFRCLRCQRSTACNQCGVHNTTSVTKEEDIVTETQITTNDTSDTVSPATKASGESSVKTDSLFRCTQCLRAFHSQCLPRFPDEETRFKQSQNIQDATYEACKSLWKCAECIVYCKPVDRIMTYRTVQSDEVNKSDDDTTATKTETSQSVVKPSPTREFLVKWEDTSYRHLTWVSENWVAVTATSKYKHLLQRMGKEKPKTEDEVVPRQWMMVDRILAIEYEDAYSKKIEQVLATFCGLTYDDACWDSPPPKSSDLYPAFEDALRLYRLAEKVTAPSHMKKHVAEVKTVATKEAYAKHELKKQPDFITGGTLMPHQLDGLNWLAYQWEHDHPCILADDMGLGKTIQIVSFLSYLYKRYDIFPFCIVVPNSTATNWLREFNKWAPDMVVVPYHGSSRSRKLARDYEIFPSSTKDKSLRCHAIIFTYESALSDLGYFQRVNFWPVMVVDEAHRLKNNASQLFQKLLTLRCGHYVLLTGTPLQNNIRELMNIMHFVHPSQFADVDQLEKKYAELSHDVVQELHERLKPYFLRRTKQLVLKTLPPISEIIVPISMTDLQKEVYKQILSRNIVSFAALAGNTSQVKASKAYHNVLMQLRKTLNHPYLMDDVEIAQPDLGSTHRLLIEACEKLKIFHQMLPKLKAQNHRILIFSTMKLTLDVLEDYLAYENEKYVRLDGGMSQIQRVKNIDAFNARDSDISVFLLTTRAGGVGINLASADTVLMWDADFNPHADMQAISRAYRIGQTKPVLVLKFMTRLSVEEKIMQLGKKKMILDHLVVEKMDDKELESEDVESILKFGAQSLFEGDNSKDIVYDSAAIDKLLDRSHMSNQVSESKDSPMEGVEETNENSFSFSFAKVWTADGQSVSDDLTTDADPQEEQDSNFWRKFLEEKQQQLKLKQQEKEALGRGARKRVLVSYYKNGKEAMEEEMNVKRRKHKGKGKGKAVLDQDDEDFVLEKDDYISEDELAAPVASPTIIEYRPAVSKPSSSPSSKVPDQRTPEIQQLIQARLQQQRQQLQHSAEKADKANEPLSATLTLFSVQQALQTVISDPNLMKKRHRTSQPHPQSMPPHPATTHKPANVAYHAAPQQFFYQGPPYPPVFYQYVSPGATAMRPPIAYQPVKGQSVPHPGPTPPAVAPTSDPSDQPLFDPNYLSFLQLVNARRQANAQSAAHASTSPSATAASASASSTPTPTPTPSPSAPSNLRKETAPSVNYQYQNATKMSASQQPTAVARDASSSTSNSSVSTASRHFGVRPISQPQNVTQTSNSSHVLSSSNASNLRGKATGNTVSSTPTIANLSPDHIQQLIRILAQQQLLNIDPSVTTTPASAQLATVQPAVQQPPPPRHPSSQQPAMQKQPAMSQLPVHQPARQKQPVVNHPPSQLSPLGSLSNPIFLTNTVQQQQQPVATGTATAVQYKHVRNVNPAGDAHHAPTTFGQVRHTTVATNQKPPAGSAQAGDEPVIACILCKYATHRRDACPNMYNIDNIKNAIQEVNSNPRYKPSERQNLVQQMVRFYEEAWKYHRGNPK
ncbi:uncharacterized protein BYT42DRAFT_644051 [Radiomyces spectabilis]|uniref:uncharacterized protein n=1 Tax=Radiomyces spectabilis TaxID=64574 RepID=UPI0022204CAC|nr:uncharacterized protein BYT42DRAFT_644051 [Radiomyces spectabilis]KAI8381211.1 hypothetical protein BYT42DRAFT_644051 [Radiomyces spectabilis]